jgi:hypothetical protein
MDEVASMARFGRLTAAAAAFTATPAAWFSELSWWGLKPLCMYMSPYNGSTWQVIQPQAIVRQCHT